MAICGSGGFSRGMEVALQATQVLDKQSLKNCNHLEFSYAAKRGTRELSARIVAGRDPRSPEGDLARSEAGKMGSRPAMKRFLPRTVFVLVPSRVPWSTGAWPAPHQNGTQNEVQNDPRKLSFCHPYRIRSRKCRSHGARDGCGTSTWVPSGALPRGPPGPVPPSLLQPISGRPNRRIHRGNAGCHNVKSRGRHGSEACVGSRPRGAGP